MTPEERAAKWADQCARHDCQCGAGSAPTDDFPCLDLLADFRAAENEAIERAAQWHDQKNKEFKDKLYRDHTKFAASGGRWNWHHEEFAAHIRALKHPTSS